MLFRTCTSGGLFGTCFSWELGNKTANLREMFGFLLFGVWRFLVCSVYAGCLSVFWFGWFVGCFS